MKVTNDHPEIIRRAVVGICPLQRSLESRQAITTDTRLGCESFRIQRLAEKDKKDAK